MTPNIKIRFDLFLIVVKRNKDRNDVFVKRERLMVTSDSRSLDVIYMTSVKSIKIVKRRVYDNSSANLNKGNNTSNNSSKAHSEGKGKLKNEGKSSNFLKKKHTKFNTG